MNAILSTTAHRIAISTFAALALAASLPEAGFAQPARQAGIWTINLAKSKFGPDSNTLVLQRAPRNAASQSGSGNGNAAPSNFLVISDQHIYMATDTNAQASSGAGLKAVDYAGWRNMKLALVGDNVRYRVYCSFRCQQGLADNRPVTVTFTAKGIDMRAQQIAGTVMLDQQ